MSFLHSHESTPAPAAPMHPGAITYSRPIWPVALGAVSIALGIQDLAGLLIRSATTLLPIITGFLNRTVVAIPEGPPWVLVLQSLSSLTQLLGVLLLIGGIKLCHHHRSALPLHVLYAVLKILVAIVTPACIYGAAPEYLRSSPSSFLIWQIARVPLTIAYPVFLLVWFSRAKIRQQARGWAAEREASIREAAAV